MHIRNKYLDISAIAVGCLYVLLLYIWFIQGQTYPDGLLENYRALRYLPYILIVTLAPGLMLFIAYHRRGPAHSQGSGALPLTLISIYILLTGIYLGSSPITLVEGWLVYLKYPFLCVMLSYLATPAQIEKFLLFALAVSVAIALEPLFTYTLFDLHGDYTYLTLGPWGGHAVAGIILLYCFCLVAAHMVLGGGRWKHIGYIYLVVLAIIISSNRGTFLTLAPMLGMLYLIAIDKFNPRLIYLLSIAINGLVILLAYALYAEDSMLNIMHILNPMYRLHYIGGVYELLSEAGQLLTGAGIRSMKPDGTGDGGWVFAALQVQDPNLVLGGSNQYTKALAELGFLGCILYWLLLAGTLARAIRWWEIIRYRNDVSLFTKSVVLAFFGIWLHFSSFGLFYNDLWRFDASALLFWSMAAYVCLGLHAYRHNRCQPPGRSLGRTYDLTAK